MKFLAMLATSFAALYLALVAHALSFPTQQKNQEIEALSLRIKDTKPSLTFPTHAHQRFVYAF